MQCLSCQTDNPPANRFCDQRVSVGVAEALLALGVPALRGEHAILGRRWDDAVTELGQALAIGRKIQYPTLVWQAGHLLARAQAEARRPDEAIVTARLALESIDAVAARAPDLALRQTFLAWQRVVEARENLDRLIRI